MQTNDSSRHPLRASLFPNQGPFLRILPVYPDSQLTYDPPLPAVMKQISFCAPNGISPIVEECIQQSGYSLNNKHQSNNATCIWETLPITEKGKDEINFSGIGSSVKINQFPGLFAIGRKDYLALNYQRMLDKHGKEHFNFSANTYVLPEDYEKCKAEMKTTGKVMIVKPPNYYCGIGIKMISNPGDMNRSINVYSSKVVHFQLTCLKRRTGW